MSNAVRQRNGGYKSMAKSQLGSVLGSTGEGIGSWDTVFEKWLIEFGGCFAIVFAIGMAIHQGYTVPIIAATFGAVTCVLHCVYDEQHFNPFVTLQGYIGDVLTAGFAEAGFTTVVGGIHVLWLWGIQLAGSVAGAAALAWAFNDSQMVGATVPAANVTVGQIIFYEFLGSFFYGSIVFRLSAQGKAGKDDRTVDHVRAAIIQKVALPMSAGLLLFIATILIFAYTGASINFVRSIGPAIISRNFKDLGYVFLGQLLGYSSSACMYNLSVLIKSWSLRRLVSL